MQIRCAALNFVASLQTTDWNVLGPNGPIMWIIFLRTLRFVAIPWIPVWLNELLYRNEYSETGSMPFIKSNKNQKTRFCCSIFPFDPMGMRYCGRIANWICDDACAATRIHYEFKNTLYSLEIVVHVSMNNNNNNNPIPHVIELFGVTEHRR